MGRKIEKDAGEPDLDLSPDFDPIVDLSRLVARERDRSGPGTAARRALEALAESRRLRDQLEDLDDFEASSDERAGRPVSS